MNGPSVSQAAALMALRPSELLWGSVGISCFRLGPHCVGYAGLCTQAFTVFASSLGDSAGTTNICAQISTVEATWLHPGC